MIGGQNGLLRRFKGVLPPSWFPSNGDGTGTSPTPVLDTVANGFAAVFAWLYGLIGYIGQQTRLATSTGGWLDLFAFDFFGRWLPRWTGETDAQYEPRIALELVRDRQTLPAIVALMTDMVGVAPTVIQPWRPLDCGGYDVPTACGYDAAGAYGSSTPLWIVFVFSPYPQGYGVPNAGGYDTPTASGYDIATSTLWSGPDFLRNGPTIMAILAALDRVRAAGIQCLVSFSGAGAPQLFDTATFDQSQFDNPDVGLG